MKISDACVKMVQHHEGVKLKPYRCPAGLWTVGVGHVLYPEQAAMKIADRMALLLKAEHDRVFTAGGVDAIFRSDLIRFETGVLRLCPDTFNSQSQFDGMVSFSFNLGLGALQSSTLRMKYNRGDTQGAANEFPKWNKCAGKILNGLTIRRLDEQRMFLG